MIVYDPDVPADATDVNQEGKTLPEDAERADFAHWLLVDIPAGVQIPNATADIEACQKEVGSDARTTCFADLDKKLMETAAPWVPYLWNKVVYITAPSVTRYEFDQSSGEISFVNTAVNNNATMS